MAQIRKTKIIATLGPSSDDEKTINELVDAGVNIFRLNFSHGDHASHKAKVDIIKKIRTERCIPLAILLDTKGPEFRVDEFENRSIELKAGDKFTFTTDDIKGNQERVKINFTGLASQLEPGDTILANDGLMKFEVTNIDGEDIVCKALNDGKLSNRKSLNFPGKELKIDYLSEKDKSDLMFAIENDLDYIACSFVSNADNLLDVHKFLNENDGEDIRLIAKIENQAGIENLESICDYCCAVMVARGDLGVEVAYNKLPMIQKQIVRESKIYGRSVIICTEMLESMIENPRPTRAEASDVANAVFDGSSAVMLSGETASGKYPVEAVKAMEKIILSCESLNIYLTRAVSHVPVAENAISDAIGHAACTIAMDVDAKGIVCFTDGGYIPSIISMFKTKVPVAAITPNFKRFNQMSLLWGCTPVYRPGLEKFEDLNYAVTDVSRTLFGVERGEKIVSCSGFTQDRQDFGNYISIKEF